MTLVKNCDYFRQAIRQPKFKYSPGVVARTRDEWLPIAYQVTLFLYSFVLIVIGSRLENLWWQGKLWRTDSPPSRSFSLAPIGHR